MQGTAVLPAGEAKHHVVVVGLCHAAIVWRFLLSPFPSVQLPDTSTVVQLPAPACRLGVLGMDFSLPHTSPPWLQHSRTSKNGKTDIHTSARHWHLCRLTSAGVPAEAWCSPY